MDKKIVLSLLAMMIANDLEQSNDTIDNLNNNLNTLDDKSGVVFPSLSRRLSSSSLRWRVGV